MKGCRPLTDEEINQVLEHLARTRYPARNKALFVLGIRSGFRISELLSLKVGDFYHAGQLSDHVRVARKHMKGKREARTVLLHPQARELVAIWIRELEAMGFDRSSYLFQSRNGKNQPLDRRQAWSILRKAAMACAIRGKLGTHCMRKTFAKRMYELLGRDLMKTQKALNHARITSTVSYLGFADSEIDDAILKG